MFTNIGELVLAELKARKMSQSELARQIDIQRSAMNEMIKGKRGFTYKAAAVIEAVLGINASFLLQMQNESHLDEAREASSLAEPDTVYGEAYAQLKTRSRKAPDWYIPVPDSIRAIRHGIELHLGDADNFYRNELAAIIEERER